MKSNPDWGKKKTPISLDYNFLKFKFIRWYINPFQEWDNDVEYVQKEVGTSWQKYVSTICMYTRMYNRNSRCLPDIMRRLSTKQLIVLFKCLTNKAVPLFAGSNSSVVSDEPDPYNRMVETDTLYIK